MTKKTVNTIVTAFLLMAGHLFFSTPAIAVDDYQQCITGSSCTVGEFLYDDNYAPLAGASCFLTATSSAGVTYLQSDLVASANGWYSYNWTPASNATAGLYHSSICCDTPTDEHLCLDKSFLLVAPTPTPTPIPTSGGGATAADIWNYSDRSLTSFGSLTTDIWNYSNRSLTGFGTLIADIWGHATRTLTGASLSSGSLATKEDADLQNLNTLLEKVVNQPTVEVSIIDSAEIQSKLQDSRNHADKLFTLNQTLLAKLSRGISQDPLYDSAPTELQLSADWLKTAWDEPVTLTLYNTAQSITEDLSITNLKRFDRLLGDSSQSDSDPTVFGFLKRQQLLADSLIKTSQDLRLLISTWSDRSISDRSSQTETLNQLVFGLNQTDPQVKDLLLPPYSKPQFQLKNQVLGLSALVDLNLSLLAQNPNQPLKQLFTQDGSLIFRALVTNPSSTISQTVPLKFYLPREIKPEHILNLDDNLKLVYDTDKGSYYVSGTFKLAPKQVHAAAIETADVWTVTPDQIDIYKQQAADLLKPLENSPFYAQGVLLKSDIDSRGSKILAAQTAAETPEARIHAYREAQSDMAAIETQLDTLKNLASNATPAQVLGFSNSLQIISLWVLIAAVVIATGFFYLYFRSLQPQTATLGSTGPKHRQRKALTSLMLAFGIGGLTTLALASFIFFILGGKLPFSQAPVAAPATTVLGTDTTSSTSSASGSSTPKGSLLDESFIDPRFL